MVNLGSAWPSSKITENSDEEMPGLCSLAKSPKQGPGAASLEGAQGVEPPEALRFYLYLRSQTVHSYMYLRSQTMHS